jgi:hypothetical protein
MTNEKLQIATEILNQLGGKMFTMMTGSKNFVIVNNGLRMQLTRNKSEAKYFTVTLNAMDVYELEFANYNKQLEKTVSIKYENVYCDQLRNIFTEVTGLYTRF